MKKKRRLHLIWILPVLFLIIINFSGCLQMRKSDRKIGSQLKKLNLKPQFHDLKDGGNTIHYWDIPNPGKPLILFVHGSPGSSTALMSIAIDTQITENFMPVLVDRPGFGYSNFGQAELTLKRQSELMHAVLLKYPNRRKILVGHSLGGPLVARMAMDYPNDISELVILAGSIDPELEPHEWHRKPMASPWVRWMIPKAFNASNDEIITLKKELEKMLPFWENIKIPVVVIQGTKDGFVPKENADFAKKMLINAPLRIKMLEGGSHFFPFSKPEIVVEELMLLRDPN